MTTIMQRDLFGDTLSPAVQTAGLFAEVVFDRPLDQTYTYAVPEPLHARIGVGKRVLAPFGKGEKGTVGYCVRLTTTVPTRPVKEISRVLDDEALLTADLLRLTRWIADYYLCGWGQVLNAVVPGGAKQQAGIRSVVFLEPVAEADLPQPPPTLTAKQTAALEALRGAGRPVELRRLASLARCGLGPVEALIDKGLARQIGRASCRE